MATMISRKAFRPGGIDCRSLLRRLHIARSSVWLLVLAVIGIGIPISAQNAPQPPVQSPRQTREQWGAPAVSVTHAAGHWTIAGKRNQIVLDDSDLAVGIVAEGVSWRMKPSQDDDVLVK